MPAKKKTFGIKPIKATKAKSGKVKKSPALPKAPKAAKAKKVPKWMMSPEAENAMPLPNKPVPTPKSPMNPATMNALKSGRM